MRGALRKKKELFRELPRVDRGIYRDISDEVSSSPVDARPSDTSRFAGNACVLSDPGEAGAPKGKTREK